MQTQMQAGCKHEDKNKGKKEKKTTHFTHVQVGRDRHGQAQPGGWRQGQG